MPQFDEREALTELRRIKDSYREFIRDNFEFAAADCGVCPTFGVCCTDAHFVNVHITPLEAAAIIETLERKLNGSGKQKVYERVKETIEKYNLNSDGDTFAQTYACPLFEPRVGCLVHVEAKPAACISHACYADQTDLPPACLQENVEAKIEKLNQKVYNDCDWLPLPLQMKKIFTQSSLITQS